MSKKELNDTQANQVSGGTSVDDVFEYYENRKKFCTCSNNPARHMDTSQMGGLCPYCRKHIHDPKPEPIPILSKKSAERLEKLKDMDTLRKYIVDGEPIK